MLFKRAAMCTDIHFGAKGNSKLFNEDLMDYVDWFIAKSKELDCETCIVLGDWHDTRSSINVLTMNYSMRALKLLNDNFDQVIILAGNHDLFYREKRDVHSLIFGNTLENTTIIDEPTEKDGCLLLPWLVGDEWKTLEKGKSKYIFGHLELPGFKMNAMIDMPDHGGLNGKHFKNQDYVFSGHFHRRQYKDNIHYIGNPFGHNFGDAGDEDRGMGVIEWDMEPVYINYTDGPKYFSITVSQLDANFNKYVTPKSYIKLTDDKGLSYEDTLDYREQICTIGNARELKFVPKKIDYEVTDESNRESEYDTIDGLVISELNSLDSAEFNSKSMITLYEGL